LITIITHILHLEVCLTFFPRLIWCNLCYVC
jgi:hypothetical protein